VNIERFSARFRQSQMYFSDRDHHVAPIIVHRYDIARRKVRVQHKHTVVLQIFLVVHWIDFEHVAQAVKDNFGRKFVLGHCEHSHQKEPP
jgi:hypothetical protein